MCTRTATPSVSELGNIYLGIAGETFGYFGEHRDRRVLILPEHEAFAEYRRSPLLL